MNKPEQLKDARFVVFCLEAYKRAEGISGPEAADSFLKYGVTDYLRDGFEVLHSLGEHALVADIRDFISRRSKDAQKRILG